MTKNSHHFDLASWTDFVRDHAKAELTGEMKSHLEFGCDSCFRTAGLFRGVAECAAQEALMEVPQSDVRVAKSLFRTFRKPERESLRLRFARLAAFNQPALAGLRGCSSAASHYLFEDENAALDIRIETGAASDEVSIVGQVLSLAETPYRHCPVWVQHHDWTLAAGTTGDLGEFALQFPVREELLLIVELDENSFFLSWVPSRVEES
jgi:hypothetical protein